MMLSVILLSILMILLSTLSLIRYLICGNNQNWLMNLNLIYETLVWDRKWLVDFNAGKTQLLLFDLSHDNGAIDAKMDGSVLGEKSSFKMLGLTFSSKLDQVLTLFQQLKLLLRKYLGVLIRSTKFLSPEFAVYLYRSTIQSCIEYYCHVWAGAHSHYLELSDKLQKQIHRSVDPSLAASLEPLA